jgi:PhnB protein
MQVNPYLTFNGNCEEAFNFYAKVLGGTVTAMMSHEGTPAESHVKPEWKKKILHAQVKAGDFTIMGSDAAPERYEAAKGFSVCLVIKTPQECERVFHDLADGGKVEMDIQPTFWSARFGVLKDRYGTPWMINCEQMP